MFEDLKQERQRGMSVKERTRLFLMVSLVLVVGATIYGQRQCAGSDPLVRPTGRPEAKVEGPPPRRALDPAPFEGLRQAGGAARDLDRAALDHVLREIRSGQVDLATRAPTTPAEVRALDPAAAVGTPVEVVGRVRQLDAESYESTLGSVDTLWSFALEGEDGARIVVVHGGSSTTPEGGKPLDAFLVDGFPVHALSEGDVAIVRGVHLQRKTAGTVGRISVGDPTPVVVGAAYRRLPVAAATPAPASLSDIPWSAVEDRILRQTKVLEGPQHFQALAWARARGHDAIVRDLRSGAIPTLPYDRDAFRRWYADLVNDGLAMEKDPQAPDRRDWTNAAKGKVFRVTGFFGRFDEEGWATIAPNEHGVDARWSFWLTSDHHHRFGALRFHSPFPLSAFEGIRGRTDERVMAYGVFVKNYSFTPAESKEGASVTTPYFVLLHLEPFVAYRPSSLWKNVFWYAMLALIVFGVLFYVVLIRGERKESAIMESRRIALRKRIRAHEGLPGAPEPGPSGPAPPGGAGKSAGPPA